MRGASRPEKGNREQTVAREGAKGRRRTRVHRPGPRPAGRVRPPRRIVTFPTTGGEGETALARDPVGCHTRARRLVWGKSPPVLTPPTAGADHVHRRRRPATTEGDG